MTKICSKGKHLVGPLVAVLIASACDTPTVPESAEVLLLQSTPDQWALAGAAVPAAPAVRAQTTGGAPVAGVVVTFQVASGGGAAGTSSVVTGADGTAASGGWILGPQPGENTLIATARGATVTFRALGLAAASIPATPLLSIQNNLSGIQQPEHRIIDNAQDWAEVWQRAHADATHVPAAPAIDFTQDMVILAAAGFRGAQGFTYRIEHVGMDGGMLRVYVLEHYEFCGTLPATSAPVHAVGVPRVAATVQFTIDKRQPICH